MGEWFNKQIGKWMNEWRNAWLSKWREPTWKCLAQWINICGTSIPVLCWVEERRREVLGKKWAAYKEVDTIFVLIIETNCTWIHENSLLLLEIWYLLTPVIRQITSNITWIPEIPSYDLGLRKLEPERILVINWSNPVFYRGHGSGRILPKVTQGVSANANPGSPRLAPLSYIYSLFRYYLLCSTFHVYLLQNVCFALTLQPLLVWNSVDIICSFIHSPLTLHPAILGEDLSCIKPCVRF